MRLIVALAATLMCGCAHGYYSGTFDPVRTAHGEVYVDKLLLPNNEMLFREMVVIDAPPWRVWNFLHDVEAAPLVKPWFARVEPVTRNGDTLEVRFHLRPGQLPIDPIVVQCRFDPSTLTVSSTAYETTFVRNLQVVDKVDPFGDGSQTLLTEYSSMSFKPWWGSLAFVGAEDKVAEGLRNVRDVVKLPKYADQSAVQPTGNQIRVAMPGFVAHGVPIDLAWTLSRAFAQPLMHKTEWKLITQDEVVALLDYAKRRELAGCQGGAECSVDLGRALSARQIIDASIGRIGQTFVLSASLLNVVDSSVERRAVQEARDEADLLPAVQRLAAELVR